MTIKEFIDEYRGKKGTKWAEGLFLRLAKKPAERSMEDVWQEHREGCNLPDELPLGILRLVDPRKFSILKGAAKKILPHSKAINEVEAGLFNEGFTASTWFPLSSADSTIWYSLLLRVPNPFKKEN